jgi:endoglucanase
MISKCPSLAIRVFVLWTVTTFAGLGCVDTRKGSGADGATGTGGTAGSADVGSWDDASAADDPDAAAGSAIDSGMRAITSMELVKEMGIGWNLGNTLDATGGETAWGNPLTTQAMIQAIAAAGFKSMRIPVTWRQHIGAAPTYLIDKLWMDRVQQIVDWALGAGLYAIINMHHDGGGDISAGAWLRNASKDYDGVITEYKALWTQIAARFRNHDDHLIFESMNEVGFDDLNVNGAPSQAAYDLLNQINAEFATLVRNSGGNNRQRHLLLAGYYTDIDKSVKGVVMPNDSRCILSIHYYTPSKFCLNANPTTWGSATEINTLLGQFAKVKTNFIDQGIPVILGEYGVVRTTEAASRIYWIEYVAKTSFDYGIAPYLWDNGGQGGVDGGPPSGGEFDRNTLTWRTPGLLDALLRASSGASYTPAKG